MNQLFSLPRFSLAFVNDLKATARMVALSSLAAFGIGVLFYLVHSGDLNQDEGLYIPAFLTLLFGGGLLLAGNAYADMHHPLQRYHVLMLPVSALERFLSRYLITGPLFVLYALVLFRVFEAVAGIITEWVAGDRIPPLDPGNEVIRYSIFAFFAGHAVLLLGAIIFPRHPLPRTVLCGIALVCLLFATVLLSIKIFFWDYFPAPFAFEPHQPFNMEPFWAGWPDRVHYMLLWLLYFWVLFIAYTALKDHEA